MLDDDDYLARRLDRLTLGILSDPQNPAPVIPPDLHLIKPPAIAADGTVACIYCGTRVAYAAGQLIGSKGVACGRCRQPAAALPIDMKIRRRVWPWFVGGAALAVLTFYGIWHHEAAMDRADFEHEYPVANSPADDETIAHALERWNPAAVIAGVTSPPDLSTVKLSTAACDLTPTPFMEFASHDGGRLKEELRETFANAKRGRYYSDLARVMTVAQLAGPVLVIQVAQREAPKMIDPAQPGDKLGYVGGYTSGSAWVYDIDGTLRCAGAFEAESSAVVKYTYYRSDFETKTDDRDSAANAVHGDLDDQMRAQIKAGLRRVE